MKNLKKVSIVAIVLLSIIVVSCNKSDDQVETDLTKKVTGTYTGILTTGSLKSTSPATADITTYNNYTVQVHCYGDDIDTTFLLELYEDGNMMRVCFTDDDFYNEYNHHKSENHHMMGDNGNWTNWNQHMNNEHEWNDKHYGYFDMDDGKFDYTFKIKTPSSEYTQQFVGSRQ